MSVPDELGSTLTAVRTAAVGAFFVGTHHNKLDDKGRVSIPASFRAVLAQNGSPSEVLLLPQETMGWIEIFPSQLFHALLTGLLEQAATSSTSVSEEQSYAIEAFAMQAQVLPIDGNGRINMGRDFLTRFHLAQDTTVVFAGFSYRFALMSLERYDEFRTSRSPLPTIDAKQIRDVLSSRAEPA